MTTTSRSRTSPYHLDNWIFLERAYEATHSFGFFPQLQEQMKNRVDEIHENIDDLQHRTLREAADDSFDE